MNINISLHVEIDDEKIFTEILGSVRLGKGYPSPFYSDKIPNCKYFVKEGKLYFYDFKDNIAYTALGLYCKYYNLTSKEAINRIRLNKTPFKSMHKKPIKEWVQPSNEYIPKVIPFTEEGLNYWKERGVDILNYPTVKQISGYYNGGKPVYYTRLSFLYSYNDRLKFYCPKTETEPKKFFGNAKKEDTWLFDRNSDTIIVHKSAKDQIVVDSILGEDYPVNSIHTQNEHSKNFIYFQQILEYKYIIIAYGSDEQGVKEATALKAMLEPYSNSVYLLYPDNSFKSNDFSDLVLETSIDNVKKMLISNINDCKSSSFL